MKKIWCYSFRLDVLIETEFEERPCTYKFKKRPVGFNATFPKTDLNKAVGEFVFAESKFLLKKLIIEKVNQDIKLMEQLKVEIENR